MKRRYLRKISLFLTAFLVLASAFNAGVSVNAEEVNLNMENTADDPDNNEGSADSEGTSENNDENGETGENGESGDNTGGSEETGAQDEDNSGEKDDSGAEDGENPGNSGGDEDGDQDDGGEKNEESPAPVEDIPEEREDEGGTAEEIPVGSEIAEDSDNTSEGTVYTEYDDEKEEETVVVSISEDRLNIRIMVSINSISEKYDGKSHYVDEEQELSLIGEDDLSMYRAVGKVRSGKIKNVGKTEIEFVNKDEIMIFDENGDEVSDRFEITEMLPGILTVEKRTLVLTSATSGKVYDGEALIKERITVGGDGYADKETAELRILGSQCSVGSSKNIFTVENKGKFKRDNYDITCRYGTLTVTEELSAVEKIDSSDDEDPYIAEKYNKGRYISNSEFSEGGGKGAGGSENTEKSSDTITQTGEVKEEIPEEAKTNEVSYVEAVKNSSHKEANNDLKGYIRDQNGYELIYDVEEKAEGKEIEGSTETDEPEIVESSVLGERQAPAEDTGKVRLFFIVIGVFLSIRFAAWYFVQTGI